MKLLQENPFISGLVVVALLLLGGGGYFLFSSIDEATRAQEDYESKVSQLHQLQNTAPYPNASNLQKMESGTAEMKQVLQALRGEITKSQPSPAEGVTPQQFQDDLRKAVLRIQAKAEDLEVSLGEDFYLGFNRYQTALPRPEATGELTRQLNVLEDLMSRLIETRVAEIGLQRQELPIEEGKTPEQVPLLARENITLRLTGDQGRVRLAMNSILDLPQLVTIRAISLRNSQTLGPARETDPSALEKLAPSNQPLSMEALFGDSSSSFGGGKPQSLPIVLGRESLTATLCLELLDFRGFKIEG